MKDLLEELDRWRADGKRVAVARVVNTDGSGPRLPGAAMAVNELGEVVGSVSGGCVEGAVVSEALAVLAGERQPGMISFGYSDDEAFAVGLTCGGTIHLFVAELNDSVYAELATDLRNERPVALATVIDAGAGDHAVEVANELLVRSDGTSIGTLGGADLDRVAKRDTLAELEAGRSGIRHYGPNGETTPEDLADERGVLLFVESWAPPPKMWIFGAVDFTAALARVAKVLGYRVTVCDARAVFATKRRFPMADEVRVTWPGPMFEEYGSDLGPQDAVCILTHDPKFDVPAVVGALASDVGYIGVMGSRTTHERRVERLQAAGVTEADIDRLMSPIGLDIGARTPEETAISIVSEIIANRTGSDAPSLRDGKGRIHS